MARAAGAPTVLAITEQAFIPWFLERMASADGRALLATRDAFARQDEQGVARLFQPVHRAFNLVVVDVACEVEGRPRLDPKKILAAGVTVRRRAGSVRQGWISEGGAVLGWRPLPGNATGGKAHWDPAAATRRAQRLGKNHVVMRRAEAAPAPSAAFEEAFAPLFPAPPELCAATGRTLLYGYLPLTSDERSEADPPPPAPFTADLLRERLPIVLWRSGRLDAAREAAAAAGEPLPAAPLANTSVAPTAAAEPSPALATVIAAASYLAQEPGLFTAADDDAAVAPLRTLLQLHFVLVRLPNGDATWRTLYDVLEEAYDLLVRRADDTARLALPTSWPAWSAAQEDAFVRAMEQAVAARWSALSPGETRYQNLADRYELQAFVRVDRSACGCPPATWWTPPSPAFGIVPWFEPGEAPPTTVELPAPTPEFLQKLKPNIAFKVPPEIQAFMTDLKLDGLMEGKRPGKRLGFGMICGFSIPIITICAFIVLQIFLVLFHLLFWWLPFIRICIPFPKVTDGHGGGGG
ncbi:MAG: hypothetical protein EA356_12840 [Geminicoccaceae bacterium]|nr:MAG: hypothetical protein EA356_12840 [Geminicoccaceae bacterium]